VGKSPRTFLQCEVQWSLNIKDPSFWDPLKALYTYRLCLHRHRESLARAWTSGEVHSANLLDRLSFFLLSHFDFLSRNLKDIYDSALLNVKTCISVGRTQQHFVDCEYLIDRILQGFLLMSSSSLFCALPSISQLPLV